MYVRSPLGVSSLSANRLGCNDEICSPTVLSPPVALKFSGSNGSNTGSEVPGGDGVRQCRCGERAEYASYQCRRAATEVRSQ